MGFRKGFFTDTSICIGCKACEVACKEWNRVPARTDADGPAWQGSSYDNSGHLGANTWRHVAFIEQGPDQLARAKASGAVLLGMPKRTAEPTRLAEPVEAPAEPVGLPAVRWLMSSDVCKHCTHAGCLDVCPTGALFRSEYGTVVVQADVCNGCGYCVAACPFGVIERREKGVVEIGDGTQEPVPNGGVAQKCTLCYDLLRDDPARPRPARRRARRRPSASATTPTWSPRRGPGSRRCMSRATRRLASTAPTPTTVSAAPGRCSSSWTSPRPTGCRPTPS